MKPKSRKKRPKARKAAPPVRSKDGRTKMEEASAHFVRGVLTRGEAVPSGQDLPPGATHEIVPGQGIRRKRFSLA